MTRCLTCKRGNASRIVHTRTMNVIKCPDCDLAFIDPMPDDEALSAMYNAHYYDSWNLVENAEATRRMKQATFTRLLANTSASLASGGRVLDVGCATGFFLDAAVAAGYRPFGVDIARYAIDACEARFGAGSFYCGQLQDAHFPANPDGRFDAIFMSDYIEHVRDPRAVLIAAASRLEAGGTMVITTPNIADRARRLFGARWPHFKTEHLWYFSPPSLHRLLTEAGMTVVQTRSAYKALSVSYMATQFRRYPMPLVTPIMNFLAKALPGNLANSLFAIPTGEMTIVATKRQPVGR